MPGTAFGDQPVSDIELKDLNRMRSYLRDVAIRNGVPFTSSLDQVGSRVCSSSFQFSLVP
jgi:hypothetical protein